MGLRQCVAAALIAWGIAAGPSVGSGISAGTPNLRMCHPGERNTTTKTCVVDGDMLWLHGVDYRLADFDTPEPQSDICGGAAEVALAHKASARLLDLLNSNAWTIETFGPDNTRKRVLAGYDPYRGSRRRRYADRGTIGTPLAEWRRVVVHALTAS